jgi:hypothetical protein
MPGFKLDTHLDLAERLRIQKATAPPPICISDAVSINLLNTKRNRLYMKNQSVPRCKHFPPRL